MLRIGHRGAAAVAPENTLRGFETALEAGVDLIEFDVLDLDEGELVLGLTRPAPKDVLDARLEDVDAQLDVLARMWQADAERVGRSDDPWTDDRAPVEWITDRMIVEYGLEGGDLDEDYLPTDPRGSG